MAVLIASGSAAGAEELLSPVRGESSSSQLKPGETLLDLAYRQRVGFRPLTWLNPHIDPWIPARNARVRLPTRYVLPGTRPHGLVINIPEMRLYDYTRGPDPEIFAIGIGTVANPTPLGEFAIGLKKVDPIWYVPESIRREDPTLPALVPPGRDNPLGRRWMTLGTSSYGIHGTNSRWSVGRTTTHGCIRLYEDEVRELFDRTPSGTRVEIIYQTQKWGSEGEALYLEVHPDLYARAGDPVGLAQTASDALGRRWTIDHERMATALARPMGVPVQIGTLNPELARDPVEARLGGRVGAGNRSPD